MTRLKSSIPSRFSWKATKSCCYSSDDKRAPSWPVAQKRTAANRFAACENRPSQPARGPGSLSDQSPAQGSTVCTYCVSRFIAASRVSLLGNVSVASTHTSRLSDKWAQKERPSRKTECGREDLNLQGVTPTTTSTLRVCQFRHARLFCEGQSFSDCLSIVKPP